MVGGVLGGTLFINFTDIQQQSKWGYWGVLENVLQTNSPKYDALINFISTTPCWWSGCSSTSTSPPPSSSSVTPPAAPTGLSDSVASSTQVGTSWLQSIAGTYPVAGYNVFRNGTKITTTAATSYQDTGLSAGTTYTYAVSAYDTAGNTSPQTSPVAATTLAAAPSPPAAPTVTINSPTNGTTLKGNSSVNIAANASDGNALKSITIMGDSNILITCTGTTSCSATWQGKKISQGTHVVSATAIDSLGLQSTSSVSILALH